MKKFLLPFLPLIFFSFHGISQTFQRAYGTPGTENISNVIEVSGGFLILSVTDSFGAGSLDIMLIKTNSYGDTLWCKTYGGSELDGSLKVIKAIGGGYIIGGYTYSFGPGTPAKSNSYLVKTDIQGNLQWAKAYGGIDWDDIIDIEKTPDSAYIVTSTTSSYGSGMTDALLMKIDTVGNVLWSKTYGGANNDWISDLEVLSDGGYILSGGTATYSPWTQASYIIRTNANGDTLWTKTYGGPGSVETRQIEVLPANDGYAFVGRTNNWGAGNFDIYLIKTDTAGNLLWSKTYGGIYDDYGEDIQVRGDGHLIVTGWSPGFETSSTTWGNYHSFILQVAPDGTFQLAKIYGQGPSDYVYNIYILNDGYLLSGRTGTFGMGGVDGYLIKTDFSGNVGCHMINNIVVETSPPTQTSIGGGNITTPSLVAINTATQLNSAPITPTIICLLVGENEEEANGFDINIYPNPSNGIFQLTIDNVQFPKAEIEVYNMLGELVFSSELRTPDLIYLPCPAEFILCVLLPNKAQ